MNILCHRGIWNEVKEQNTLDALLRGLNSNMGIETDLRDHDGEIVIAHDLAKGTDLKLSELLKNYKHLNSNQTLALNIKSDSLQEKLQTLLTEYEIKNYFVFDMSAPQANQYKKSSITFFTRQSEYEADPIFYKEAQGVWLDSFDSEWFTTKTISKHLENNKSVAIVSPELHKRDHVSCWSLIKSLSESLMLCTDHPLMARKYFNEN